MYVIREKLYTTLSPENGDQVFYPDQGIPLPFISRLKLA